MADVLLNWNRLGRFLRRQQEYLPLKAWWDALRMFVAKSVTWWDVAAFGTLVIWFVLQILVQRVHGALQQTDAVIHYFPAADGLLDGRGIQSFALDVYRGPAYPIGLAAIARFAGVSLFTAGKVISVLTTMLFIGFTYLLNRRVFNPAAGFLSILLIMAVNTFNWNSTVSSTDIPFAALATASLFFMVRGEKGPRWFDMVIAGALAGVAFVMRWTGQIAPVLLVVWFVLVPPRLISWRRKIGFAALFMLGFILVSVPWLDANLRLHGSAMYNEAAIAVDSDLMPVRTSMGEAISAAIEEQGFFPFVLQVAVKGFASFPPAMQGMQAYPEPIGWVMAGPFWGLIVLGFVPMLVKLDWRKLFLFLTTGLSWAALVLFHYEARFFIPQLPLYAALVAYIFTSGVLPDIRLKLAGGPRITLLPGMIFARQPKEKGRRRAGRVPQVREATGISLVVVALTGLLAVSALVTYRQTRDIHINLTESHEFYDDLMAYISEQAEDGLLRPVGARQWSPARYWIPRETGTTVLPFPRNESYDAVLPQLSFLLYDQYGWDDALEPYWDNDSLVDLTEPLAAPPELELVYYTPAPRRVMLYKVLNENVLADYTDVEATSEHSDRPAVNLWDGDPATAWRSTDIEAGDEVTVDFALSELTSINRVWLMPSPNPDEWPTSVRVSVGADAESTVTVAEFTLEPARLQSPVIFSLPEVEGEAVRLVFSTRTPQNLEEDAPAVGLAEVRFSNAVDRTVRAMSLTMDGEDRGTGVLEADETLFIDAAVNELVAEVRNEDTVAGWGRVNFYTGWSRDELQFIGTDETDYIAPGSVGAARLPLSEWADAPAPGECRPVWATFATESYDGLPLDTYGVEVASPAWVLNSRVCTPRHVVLTGFMAQGNPSSSYWAYANDRSPDGEARLMYNSNLSTDVLELRSESEDGMALIRLVGTQGYDNLSVDINADENFLLLVRVTDGDNYNYLQYNRADWSSYPNAYPDGRYIYHVLDPFYIDGDWHRFERDLQADYRAATGHEFDMIEAVSVRAYGGLQLANMMLSVDE